MMQYNNHGSRWQRFRGWFRGCFADAPVGPVPVSISVESDAGRDWYWQCPSCDGLFRPAQNDSIGPPSGWTCDRCRKLNDDNKSLRRRIFDIQRACEAFGMEISPHWADDIILAKRTLDGRLNEALESDLAGDIRQLDTRLRIMADLFRKDYSAALDEGDFVRAIMRWSEASVLEYVGLQLAARGRLERDDMPEESIFEMLAMAMRLARGGAK